MLCTTVFIFVSTSERDSFFYRVKKFELGCRRVVASEMSLDGTRCFRPCWVWIVRCSNPVVYGLGGVGFLSLLA